LRVTQSAIARRVGVDVSSVNKFLNRRPGATFSKKKIRENKEMIERKQIPYFKVGDRVRFDPTALSEWLNRKVVREEDVYQHLPHGLFDPRR